jgi:hypothetical protein
VVNAHDLAARIPGSELVELDGVEHTYFLGDQAAVLRHIRQFVDRHVAAGAIGAAAKRVERQGSYSSGWAALAPGEREVAALVADGLTNVEIAERLGSPGTPSTAGSAAPSPNSASRRGSS